MLLIAFACPYVCIRGTSVAMYDYARFNEEILGNKSIIIFPHKNIEKCDPLGMVKYVSRFDVIPYEDLEDCLQTNKVDILYVIKYGNKDEFESKKVKTVVHCVFDMSEPHGNIYAGVSESIAKKFGKDVFVPHMVALKPFSFSERKEKNLRKSLGIPETAIIMGRYGGQDTFNVLFCWEVINEVIKEREDFYFLFINTPQVVKHPRIFYLDKIVKDEDKNKFIATCDAHLECGSMGHSFGLSIAENSVNNVPIIALDHPALTNREHIRILGEKGIYFRDAKEFKKILLEFKPSLYLGKDLNCYKEYTPENVMKIFKKVFID